MSTPNSSGPQELKRSGNDITNRASSVPSSKSRKRRRSFLSPVREEESWQLKVQGACLRCRTMRRTCSQGDPCKTCLSTAEKSTQHRSLKWMECIRTTLREVNIYRVDPSKPPKKQFERLFQNPDRPLYRPDIDASIIADWLSEGGSSARPFHRSLVWKYYFAIFDIALQYHRDDLPMENIFNHFLGRALGVEFHSIKQVNPAILKGIAVHVLDMVDNYVKPSHLETFKRSRQRLVELFVLVWILYTAAVQDLELKRRAKMTINASQAMGEALVRLLWHYMIYLGSVTSLIETGDDSRSWQSRDAGCRKFILKHVLSLHIHDAGNSTEATSNAEKAADPIQSKSINSSDRRDSPSATREKAVGQDAIVKATPKANSTTSPKMTVNQYYSNPEQHHSLAGIYFHRLLDAHRGKGWAEPKLMSLIEDYLEIPRGPADRLSLLMTYRLQMKYRFEHSKSDHQIVAPPQSPQARKRIRILAPAPVWVGQQRCYADDTVPWTTQMSTSCSAQRAVQPQYQQLEYQGTSSDFVATMPDSSVPPHTTISSWQFTDFSPHSTDSFGNPQNAQMCLPHGQSIEFSPSLAADQVVQIPQTHQSSFQPCHVIATPTEIYPGYDPSASLHQPQSFSVPEIEYSFPEQ